MDSRVNIFINFCLQVHLRYLQPDIVPIATGVVDRLLTPVANWPLVSLTQVANFLPPVSTTLVKLVAKFATGVVDAGGAP